MKKLLTILATGVLAFAGTTLNADARPHHGNGYRGPATVTYVSGYRHGRPIYTQKIFVGYDSCGNARYSYRTVSAPRQQYRRTSYSPTYRSSTYSNYRNNGYSNNGNYRRSSARAQYRYCR